MPEITFEDRIEAAKQQIQHLLTSEKNKGFPSAAHRKSVTDTNAGWGDHAYLVERNRAQRAREDRGLHLGFEQNKDCIAYLESVNHKLAELQNSDAVWQYIKEQLHYYINHHPLCLMPAGGIDWIELKGIVSRESVKLTTTDVMVRAMEHVYRCFFK
jgi:hypothetical protein